MFPLIFAVLKTKGNQGSVVQLVRMPPCHGGGRGFESRPVRINFDETRAGRGFLLFYSIFYSIKKEYGLKSYLVLPDFILHYSLIL